MMASWPCRPSGIGPANIAQANVAYLTDLINRFIQVHVRVSGLFLEAPWGMIVLRNFPER
jgi:hypothetical protein